MIDGNLALSTGAHAYTPPTTPGRGRSMERKLSPGELQAVASTIHWLMSLDFNDSRNFRETTAPEETSSESLSGQYEEGGVTE